MSRKGFTLLELLIAVCAALVMFGIIVGTFMVLDKDYDRETQIAEMQQRVKAGIRTMTQELPMAGSDPSGTAGAGLVAAGSDTIHFTMDLNGDGDVSDADEDITYTLDTGRLQLTRNGQPLAEHIPPDGLLFSYFDHNGHDLNSTPLNAAARDMVSRITVELTGRTAKPDPNYLNGGYRTKTLKSDVFMPNLSVASVSTTATSSTPTTARITTKPAGTTAETTSATTTTPMTTPVKTTTTPESTTKAATTTPTTPGTTSRQTTIKTTMSAQTTTPETTTTEYIDRQGPKISRISQVPSGSSVPENKTVAVCAEITDPSGVASVSLSSDKHGNMTMSVYAGETYCGNLSKHNNETVTYYIIAHDSLGNESSSGPYSYSQGG